MQRLRLYITLLILFIGSLSRAQVVYCPPNIDFEGGNFTNWRLYTGSCCPGGVINANTFQATPVATRHTITSGSDTDYYGGFPVVAPNSGSYSLKLGNNAVSGVFNNGLGERARYYIKVPNNMSNYSLLFRYAVVFEDPNHTAAQQPRFEVRAYDSATNAAIPCIQFSFVASANLPGFTLSPRGTQVWYKPWSTASLDLSGLGGKTIAIDFASGDCHVGAHFGYGYVDMSCSLFQVTGTVCKGTATSQLTAPSGFFQYKWYNETFTTLIDTLQTISVPTPADSNKYHVVLVPYAGFGCPDTLETTIYVSDLVVNANPDTLVCLGNSIQLRDTATASSRFLPLTYNWSAGPNLSCTNCLDPVASPTASTNKYVLRVTDVTGCAVSDSLNITVREQHINSQPQNILQCRGTRAVFRVVAAGSSPFYYQWRKNGVNIPGATLDSLVLQNIVYTDTAAYTVAVMGDCDTVISSIARLSVYPTPVIVTQPNDVLQCPGTRAVFRSTATNGALNYTWKKNNTTIPGADKDSLVINAITASDVASYFMMVGGQCDTVYSDTADLLMKPVTAISIHPQPVSECLGAHVLFRVVASGSGTLTYQWKKNGTNIPGATNDTLILTNITTSDGASYTVMVKSECDSLLSTAAVLTLNPAVNISSQPSTLTQCSGTRAMFRVTATGTGTLRYQWKKNTINITGETKDSLVLTNITHADTAAYTVVVMTDCDTVTSSIARLNIYPTPVIVTQPNDVLQCPGTRAVFRSTATNGALNYTWKKNNTTIPGADKDSLVINAITASDVASYFMMVGGQCDTVYSDTADLLMKPVTAISIHPQPVSECLGAHVLFRVVASGSGTLTYQWKKNGTNIPGATNDTLILTNIGASDGASYTVMVKSECDSLLSTAAVLTLNPAVNISSQPSTLTQCSGTRAMFRVTATGTGTLRYQWKKNTINITGETKDSLVLTNITHADTAAYTVVVMTDCDTLTSSIARLNIYPTPVIVTQPNDVLQCPGTRAVFRSTATNGALNYTWKKNNTTIPGADKDSLVINAITASDVASYFMMVGGQCDTVYSDTADLLMKPVTAISIHPQPVSECLGAHVLFRVVASGSGTLTYQWKKNGTNIPGATNDTLILTNITTSDGASYTVMVKSECDSLLSTAAVLTLNPAVNISSQPSTLTQCSGTRAMFRVTATGTGTLRYQWKKNTINITGETKDSLVLTNITHADTAAYTVVVMTDCDTLTSSIARLNIYPTPVIVTQPNDVLQCPGTRAVFRSTATNGALNYTWKKNNTTIPGADKDSLVINAITASDVASYFMMVGGQCDTVYSDTADLLMKPVTAISIHPQPVSECLGAHVLFRVVASGSGTLTYQWKKNGTNIPGATNDTLLLFNVSATDAATYAVMVTSECDSAQSSNALLTLNPATVVNTQPVTITQCTGSKAIFSVVASGSGPISYQWKKNGVEMSDATSDSLIINNIGFADTAAYTVVVMAGCDTVTSNIARLNIYPTPVITVQPNDVLQCPGTRAVFRSTATNGALNYTWKKNNTTIPGADKDSLVINAIAASDVASYFMMVGGQCDTVYSDTADLLMKPVTAISIHPQPVSECLGAHVLFRVVASGSGTLTYQWKKNGTNIPGATNDTLILTNIGASDGASYTVMVKSECDSLLSTAAVLTLNPAVNISSQPSTLTQCSGTRAMFRVTATGTGTLRYQWKKNTINITGETKDSLVLTNITHADTAAYTVVVMTDCDTLTSSIARLNIYPTPVIVTQSNDVLQCPGTRAVFRSTATNGALNYTWKKNNTTIPGADKDSLVINAITASDVASYFMMVGGQCDSVYSDTVSLHLKELTSIVVSPQINNQCYGNSALFSVVANGAGTFTYQWKKAGVNIPGATNDTLFIPSVTYADTGSYTVSVTSECDSTQSTNALLNMNPATLVVSQPSTITQCSGTRAVFRVTGTGTGAISYQWRKNGINITGATTDSLIINNIGFTDTAAYTVVVMADCDTVISDIARLNIYPTPVIVTQPNDVLQCPGTRAVFRSTATNGALNYTWKKNNTTIPGADKDSLVINAITASDVASYFMMVGGQCDSVYSDTVSLHLKELTSIVVSPQINNQCYGNSALFSVVANGAGTFTYQWKKAGVNIPGATNDTLFIPSVTFADTGSYTVSVTSECDSTQSTNALLNMNPATLVVSQPSTITQCSGTRAVFRVTGTGTGAISYQWRKNGINITGETKDSLVLTNITHTDTAAYTVVVMADCDTVISDIARLNIYPTPVIVTQPNDVLQCPGTRAVFRSTATNGALNYTWKKNNTTIPGADKDSLVINAITASDVASYFMMVGGQCDSVYSDTVSLHLKELTSIVVSPQINNQCYGNSALFSVVANGAGTFTYQWKKAGVNIPGATNDTLFIPSVTFADTGSYTVSVTSECDSTQSTNALLNMNPATLVVSQPSTITQCSGTRAVFRVTGTGTGSISYQWRKNGVNLLGQTKDSLVINNIGFTDTAAYTVVVMADCDTVISDIARLNIYPTPVIVTQPNDVLQCPGTRVVFRSTATNGALNYTWKKNNTTIPGADKDSLVINAITASDVASYFMMVSGQCDSVYSDTVSLHLKELTSIVVSPQINNQCYGNSALFSVVANGAGTFTYQWKKAGVNIPGATNDTLFIPSVTFADTGSYTVSVTSECDSTQSTNALLNMNPATLVVSQPSTITQCSGTRAVFRVTGTGTGSISYQWRKNGINITGETKDSLVLTNITHTDTAAYTVVVMADCDTVISDIARLNIYPTPVIVTQPNDVLQCPGTRAVFRSTATNGALNYTWKKNNTTIPGADKDSLVINAITASDVASYFMMVGGQCDSVYSDTVSLHLKELTSIVVSPQINNQCYGNSALFSVVANGAGTFTYQWKKAGVNIPGATNDTLFIPSVTYADTGSYTVSVTSECDSTQSTNALLNMNPATLVVSQPSTITQCSGTRAVFRVTGTGTGSISYQWRKNGINITGATTDSLIINNIGFTDTAAYTVVVMADCDTVISDIARLNIYPTPVIVTQPNDVLQCPGTRAVFRSTATNGALNYTWKKNNTTIPGADKDSLVINAITGADTASYFMIVGGQCNTVHTDTVKLKMKLLTAVVMHAQTDSQCLGGSAWFCVVPEGSGSTYSYQWKKNGVNIPGTDNDTLRLNNLTITDFADYSVMVKSECDSILSSTTLLYRNPPTVITSQPVTIKQCIGTRAVFRVTATGTGLIRYQWKKNGINITGAITDSLVINNIQPGDSAIYTVMVKSECDSMLSMPARLHLHPVPQVSLPDEELCADHTVLSVPDQFAAYLWSTGSVTHTTGIATEGSYWIQVTDTNTCINRDTADITIKQLPAVNAGNDTTMCNEATLKLNAQADHHSTVQWQNNSFGTFSDPASLTSSFTPDPGTNGTVTLTVIVSNRCGSDTDELVVTFTPKTLATFITDTLVCEGSPLITLNPANAGGVFSGPYVTGSVFNPVKAGIYEVTYKIARNGCVDSTTQKIRVIAVPVPSFHTNPARPNIDKEVEFVSTSTNALKYLWRFDDGETDTLQVSRHFYAEEGTYWIELVAINEICRDSISRPILIEGSEKVWVPNVFTPNGDGLNDRFRVHFNNSRGGILLIYNRWGEELLRTENLEEGWDGTFKGQICQDDVYVWIFRYYTSNNVMLQKSGTVTLLH